MSDVISDYQKWKQQGEDLRSQAKAAMELRFRELLGEAVKIAEMYRADFGAVLKPPPAVTSFRFKASAKPKAKKAAPKNAPVAAPASAPAVKPNPKVAGLQKKLDTARKKLDAAKTAGSPTRALEDKIYEIEDELRLQS
jgi:hypothetical protein